jgi:N utilization substance protein B
MGQRHKARELALQCLYAHESVGQAVDDVIDNIINRSSLDEDGRKFAEMLCRKVWAKLESIDHDIERHSRNWDISRLAMVDKNILRLAICELTYFPDIPARVAINEGVELAKRFSTHESSRFVNGILDAVFRDSEAAEVE